MIAFINESQLRNRQNSRVVILVHCVANNVPVLLEAAGFRQAVLTGNNSHDVNVGATTKKSDKTH